MSEETEEYEEEGEEEENEEEEEDEEEDEEYEESVDEEAAKAAKKARTKKLAIIGGVIFGVAGAGYGAHVAGLTEVVFGKPTVNEVTLELGKPVSIPFAEIRTDLKKVRRRSNFIKMTMEIQLNEQHAGVIEEKKAAILDGVQSYLRDQEFKDLQGKAGVEKLRHDITRIINVTIAPVKAHTVFFTEIIMQ